MLSFEDHPHLGWIEIEGIKYSHELFKDFAAGLAVNEPFKIIERRDDGYLVIKRLLAEKIETVLGENL